MHCVDYILIIVYNRYQKKCDELEVSQGQFKDQFDQMARDKHDIVSFWKRQVDVKSRNILLLV